MNKENFLSDIIGSNISISDIRERIIGLDRSIGLVNGTSVPYVNFDNAATTPPFKSVLEKIEELCQWYGSVSRGTGLKSQLSSHVYNECRRKVLEFVSADPSRHVAIFTSNATCAINKLCNHIELKDDEAILVTVIEHHSNMLPWRVNCSVEYVDVFDDNGNFSCQRLEEKLKTSKKKIRLVAITGASNVTGVMPPIPEVARIVHNHQAELLVDAAQLIACRPVKMLDLDNPERIDYLVFSAHKMYAPFGVGVIIGPQKTFLQGEPDLVGGGTVDLVTLDDIQWTDIPNREEAGTPNLIGVVALVEAIKALESIGWDFIISHNRQLTKKLLDELSRLDKINIYGGSTSCNDSDRVGVVSFNVKDMPHSLLAAVLGYEWGIGVRNGCFCAHLYVAKLLGIDDKLLQDISSRIKRDDHSNIPGMVRVSFGIYNTFEEIDYFINALENILKNGPQTKYILESQTGRYMPKGFNLDFDQYFSI